MAADTAGDRRHHVGELDIELGCLERAFGDGFGGVRRLQGLAALVDDLFGDRTGLDKVQPAVELALGEFRLGTGIRELPVCLGRYRFERTRVDDVEQVAGMNHVAVLELDIGNEAADPGADLHLFDCLEAAGEFIPIGHGAPGGRRDGDRRRRGGLRRRLFAAARQADHKQNGQRSEATARGELKQDRLSRFP